MLTPREMTDAQLADAIREAKAGKTRADTDLIWDRWDARLETLLTEQVDRFQERADARVTA